jgi:hypothetical protein
MRFVPGFRRRSSKGWLPPSFQTRIQHFKKGERDYQPGWQVRANRTVLATQLLALSRLTREGSMGRWLVADLSVTDFNFQPRMVPVAALVCFRVDHTPRSLMASLAQMRAFLSVVTLPLALQDHPQG